MVSFLFFLLLRWQISGKAASPGNQLANMSWRTLQEKVDPALGVLTEVILLFPLC